MPEAAPVPLARRSGCRRLVVLLAGVPVLLIAALLWWAWANPGTVLGFVLQRVPAHLRPEVGTTRLDNGQLVLEKIVLKQADRCIVQVEELRWAPDPRRLAGHTKCHLARQPGEHAGRSLPCARLR